MKTIFVAILTLLLIGCLHDKDEGNEEFVQPINKLNFKISQFDAENSELLDTEIDSDSKLIFPFIPGQIVGEVSDENLFELEYSLENEYVLEFSADIFTEETAPTTLSDTSVFEDLEVNVNAGKLEFGRLGTFSVTTENERDPSENFGFYDSDKDIFFLIVYFDRKYHLSGSMVSENQDINMTIDIDVPEAGFYAIATGETTTFFSSIGSLTAFNPSDNIYFIIVDNTKQSIRRSKSVNLNSLLEEEICVKLACR